jgi:hypothetical protein
MVNKTIRILQNLSTHTLTLHTVELPHHPEYSRDRKEFPNFISKVHLKLVGENGHFSDDQHQLCYIHAYFEGNAQTKIQLYIRTDKMSLDNAEALVKHLEAAFGDHDEVGMASAELDQLTQGNC